MIGALVIVNMNTCSPFLSIQGHTLIQIWQSHITLNHVQPDLPWPPSTSYRLLFLHPSVLLMEASLSLLFICLNQCKQFSLILSSISVILPSSGWSHSSLYPSSSAEYPSQHTHFLYVHFLNGTHLNCSTFSATCLNWWIWPSVMTFLQFYENACHTIIYHLGNLCIWITDHANYRETGLLAYSEFSNVFWLLFAGTF